MRVVCEMTTYRRLLRLLKTAEEAGRAVEMIEVTPSEADELVEEAPDNEIDYHPMTNSLTFRGRIPIVIV